MRLAYTPYTLRFHEPATTSRQTMTEKGTCFLKLYDENEPERYGIGEAALFFGLSPEANSSYEYKIMELASNIALGKPTDLSRHSSLQFGLEQAIRDFTSGGQGLYFPSQFTEGQKPIEINGLVWMGSQKEMKVRVHEKIAQGYRCIKFKIGALHWTEELELLKTVRTIGPDLEIRVDANGNLPPDAVMKQLGQLADLGVHSIEQPVSPRHWDMMSRICKESPVPVALDEELIGLYTAEERIRMLDIITPGYIVLKPALCGGFAGAEDWIALARDRGIGWWVTSALETNVGLTAIAQWASTLQLLPMAQGLGTGSLYTNNTPSRLVLSPPSLLYNTKASYDLSFFDSLPWRNI